jgi:hypothetical protein
MSFERPVITRGGRISARPTPPVSAGIRQRGRSKKLTPFVSFRADIAESIFTKEFLDHGGWLVVLVGKGANAGKVRLLKSTEDDSDIRLRRPTKLSDEWIVETVSIPGEVKNSIKRTAITYSQIENGVEVSLPWIKKSSEL